jgi:hypothetical protein
MKALKPAELMMRKLGPRFSLRTFLVVLILFSAWIGIEISRIQKKTKAIAAIEQLGGTVDYDYRHRFDPLAKYNPNAAAPGPLLLRNLLGENCFANVVEVQLFGGKTPQGRAQFSDNEAAHLAVFSELRWLVLIDTSITDDGLKHLVDLKKLERLDLEGTRVTEAGVRALHATLPRAQIFFDDGYIAPEK